MSTVIAALLDVSYSMKSSIGEGVEEDGGTWAHSIFRVIDDLVTYDVSQSNRVFFVGVGAQNSQEIFDILTTIKDFQAKEDEFKVTKNIKATKETIESIFTILETNGAHTIRRWASVDTVSSVVSEYEARKILQKLRTDRSFTCKFVNQYLPPACRSWGDGQVMTTLQSFFTVVATQFTQAKPDDIEEVVAKASQDLTSNENALLTPISTKSVYSVKEASSVLHKRIEESDLTSERVQELLNFVEPYIYGSTPLHTALNDAASVFRSFRRTFEDHRKLLFVLSDGEPTDKGDPGLIKRSFEQEDVSVIGCFISNTRKVASRKLHNVSEYDWDDGAKFLFDLSSCIPTSLVTRAIFIKNKWNIDIANNETKLFMQVNHPDNLKDVCNLVRNAVCCEDSLSEVLVSVSLDLYINDTNRSVNVYDQGNDGTCYAHASATVIHLAMHRILGRIHGYPNFEDLRDEMIHRHGTHGANTLQVLQTICPRYRLRCRQVDVHGAMKAITEKRPVVVKFRLTEREWGIFNAFFRSTPFGILTKRDLDVRSRSRYEITSGHAVVLTSFNSKCLQLMNSWGGNWADRGFFKVEDSEILMMEFIDVYWEESDLLPSEKEYYKKHGAEVAETLMKSLKALQMATFTCPHCRRASNVDDFSGTLSRICCPLCEREFSGSEGEGNLLALNIYLTTLSR